MEAIVQQRLITVKALKRGFFVMLNDEKYLITGVNMNEQTATIAKVTISDKIVIGESITVNIEEINDKVLRYSGLVGENRRPFDLKYEDYVRAIDGLKEDCYVVKEKKNAKIDDVVRITDIKIIDANSLYQIENRKGVIVDMQTERNKKVVFFVRLDSKNGELGKTLSVERDSFELVDGDTHSLLHIKCASCEM